MMRRSVSFLTAGMLAVGVSALVFSAQKEKLSAAEVLEKVQRAYAGVDDASADFTQTVSLSYAKVEQSFTGKVMMKKGNKYRVESQEQTLVTDGKTVWAYSPVNKQVLIDSYKENPNTLSPEQFLVGLPKNFRAALVEDNSGDRHAAYCLKLSPTSGSPKSIKSLKVWIDDADWSVRQVEYIDMNETRTVYTMTNIRFNPGIPDERFTFTVPDHVEIVDLRSSGHPAPRQ
ncbi:MAG TPA: outer membrane lipoprotein chaperone LolA [Bacteroidota bacterium]|nr:outer membrane lipoprotein chaperone LolA [Bacteroidota bacterium]